MDVGNDQNPLEFFHALNNFEVFPVDVPDEQFVSADRRNEGIEKPGPELGEPCSENTGEMKQKFLKLIIEHTPDTLCHVLSRGQ